MHPPSLTGCSKPDPVIFHHAAAALGCAPAELLHVGDRWEDDVVGAHHPDAHAFLAPRVDVARVLDGHLRVGRMQAAAVLVVEAGLAAHEHFPKRPFGRRRGSRRRTTHHAAR